MFTIPPLEQAIQSEARYELDVANYSNGPGAKGALHRGDDLIMQDERLDCKGTSMAAFVDTSSTQKLYDDSSHP